MDSEHEHDEYWAGTAPPARPGLIITQLTDLSALCSIVSCSDTNIICTLTNVLSSQLQALRDLESCNASNDILAKSNYPVSIVMMEVRLCHLQLDPSVASCFTTTSMFIRNLIPNREVSTQCSTNIDQRQKIEMARLLLLEPILSSLRSIHVMSAKFLFS